MALAKEDLCPLVSPWISYVIIKAVGGSFSFDYLKSALGKIWNMGTLPKLVAIGRGFYIMSSPSVAVKEKILEKWVVVSKLLLQTIYD